LSGDDRPVWGEYFEGINQFLGLWFFSAWVLILVEVANGIKMLAVSDLNEK